MSPNSLENCVESGSVIMPQIILLQGGEATTFELKPQDMVLGRHPDCDIVLQSNMISRRHAKVTLTNGKVMLEDLGSGNGTFLNGEKIESPVQLKHEDRFKLGPMLFRFADGANTEKVPASSQPAVSAGSKSSPGGLSHPTVLSKDDSNPKNRRPVNVDLSAEDNSQTIMGAADLGAGFGSLNVKPEVKLKAILEISRSLAGTPDLDAMLPKILDTLFSIFPQADRGCILLKDDHGQIVPRSFKHRRADFDESIRISKTILNKVLDERTGILSADASSDLRFSGSESISNLTIRSIMCVPMLSLDGEPIGAINIDTQNPISQFRPDDLDLLLAVSGQAALCYENTRLLASFAEKQKYDNEMRIAKNVQRALLPDDLPQRPGYKFYASYEAAQAVGGDYYDIITLGEGKICLAFGDVAGKGVPASLVMSRISSVVRCTVEFLDDAKKAAYVINNHMCAKAVEGRFVTFVLIIIDMVNHQLTLVNAGHMSPMIRKPDGSIEEFSEDNIGVPLGVMEDYDYEVETRQINPGETFVIYTDGVSEAMNHQSELYTVEHLRDFVSAGSADTNELGKAILVDVKRHANGRPQNDDITLMCFGREAQ